MKVAIIGAKGFVGRYLSRAHAERGDQVFEFSSSTQGGIDLNTGLFPTNFSFPPELDTVYFLAQSPRYRAVPAHADHLLCVNCVAAVQAAETARKSNVNHFIYASTGNIYTPSFDPLTEYSSIRRDAWYSLSKVMAEDALALFRSDIRVTIARIFGVYGPGQTDKLIPSLIDSVRSGKPIFVDQNPNDPNDIDGLRVSFMFINDLIQACMQLADHPTPPEFINLGGEYAISVRTIAEMMGRFLQIDPIIKVTETNRLGDLIADISLLKSMTSIDFAGIEYGLSRTLAFNRA